MMFLNPWGLLGLLGLVALLIIYILKPKYQEKTLSSTYIWKLSLKYRKPKTPFDWIRSSLILILQILILTTLTLLMTDPNYKLNTLSGEKIVLLDASASMYKESARGSYFDLAKQHATKLAERTAPKDRFSIIYASDEPYFVVRRSSSLDYIKQNITNLKPTKSSVDYTKSMDLLEHLLRENPNSLIYFYTNKEIDLPANIEVINFSVLEHNIGILDFKAVLKPNGQYTFEAQVLNYGKAVDATFTLFVNGAYQTAKQVSFEAEENSVVSFDYEVLTFQDAYLTIDREDGYLLDNQFRIYGEFGTPIKVSMYSESEDATKSSLYFVRNALEALSKRFSIDVYTNEEDLKEGYDLYVYDTYIPPTLPTDGSIWVINSDIPTLGVLSSSEEVGSFHITKHQSNSLAYKKIASNLDTNQLNVTKYKRLTHYPEFERLLSIDGYPIVLTKDLNGQKITIFSFDFSYSNLPLNADYPLMMMGLFDYSNPSIIDKQHYYTGEKIYLNLKPDAYRMILTINDEQTIIDTFPFELNLDEVGTYLITQKFENKTDEYTSFYVSVKETESYKTIDGGTLVLPYIPTNKQVKKEDMLNLMPYITLFLYVIILIEWWVQYREQY